MNSILGQRVRLRLFDPDAGYGRREPTGGWPTLEGRISSVALGLHDKNWYGIELDQDLPAGFQGRCRLRLLRSTFVNNILRCAVATLK
jgi:hypothetical protein